MYLNKFNQYKIPIEGESVHDWIQSYYKYKNRLTYADSVNDIIKNLSDYNIILHKPLSNQQLILFLQELGIRKITIKSRNNLIYLNIGFNYGQIEIIGVNTTPNMTLTGFKKLLFQLFYHGYLVDYMKF